MEFLKKDDVLKLMNDFTNVKYAFDVVNIYNQRSFNIYLKSVDDIDYSIHGYFFGYTIDVSKTNDVYNRKEVLYKKRFSPIIFYKIKKIVKKYERIEKCKRLKEILE